MEIQHRYSIYTTLISLRTTEQQGPQCTNHRRHAARQAGKIGCDFVFKILPTNENADAS